MNLHVRIGIWVRSITLSPGAQQHRLDMRNLCNDSLQDLAKPIMCK